MNLSKILTEQVIILFILIAVGFILKKSGKINDTSAKQLSTILLSIVIPSVLIESFQKDFQPELVYKLISAVLFTFVIHVAMIIIASLMFRKEPTGRYKINIFTSIYSNCGFMALPLLDAVLGSEGIFYGSAYMIIFNLLYWTHGVAVYSGGVKELSVKKAFINPGIIGVSISLLMFFLQIRLPKIILTPVAYMADLNTPLAMVILGTYLANIDFKKTLKKLSIYGVSFLRLLLFPAIGIVIAKIFSLDTTMATAIIISTACPSAAVATLFAVRFNEDAEYASEIVSITTLFSIATIPLVMMLM